MEKRLNKRGISQVVTTLLFVLIALGAVLLVWTLVRGTITTSSDQIKVDEACLKLELIAESCTYEVVAGTPETYNADVKYSRGNKDPGLTVAGVKLVFEDATGQSESEDITTAPGVLETKTSPADGLTAEPAKVSVAGVLTAESGNDVPCPLGEAIVCQDVTPAP